MDFETDGSACGWIHTPFLTPDDCYLHPIGPLIICWLHHRLHSSSGDLCLEAIALPFAWYLTIHRYGEWHAIGQEQREKPVRSEVSCDDRLPVIDHCQERPDDQCHLDRKQQCRSFEAIGDERALASSRVCQFDGRSCAHRWSPRYQA